MADDNSFKTAKDGIALVGEVLKAAGDSPQVKEAANNLGQTAVTITRTINNVLVPLAAINFAFDKARAYFSGTFQKEFAEKAATIPPEHLVEPKASIAGPALQGIAFTHGEPTLKEMYLKLLATAMDGRSSQVAHPGFVEIIKQLDGDEAVLIRFVLSTEKIAPIVRIHVKLENGGYKVLFQNLLDWKHLPTAVPVERPDLPAMVDNWIRLGLVAVQYDQKLVGPQSYSWVEQRPEFIRLKNASHANEGEIEYTPGTIQRTDFGKRFAEAVGITSPW